MGTVERRNGERLVQHDEQHVAQPVVQHEQRGARAGEFFLCGDVPTRPATVGRLPVAPELDWDDVARPRSIIDHEGPDGVAIDRVSPSGWVS